MHDIWNPWHGCVKKSEGCDNCYMYFLDRMRGGDGRKIFKTKNFAYPLSRGKDDLYKVKSGEAIRVCMTSDFFLEEADEWRDDAWNIIKERSDVFFFLLTKRPERVEKCLPNGDVPKNVFFNVTCENQKRADERIPYLLSLPFYHKGIMTAPLIGGIKIEKYLDTGQIEQVICGGENYDGARICNFEWVKELRRECEERNIRFCFIETGTSFLKDGRLYKMPDKRVQSEMAFKSGASFEGKKIDFTPRDHFGMAIPKDELYKPYFGENCKTCGSRMICNGCARCGKCNL